MIDHNRVLYPYLLISLLSLLLLLSLPHELRFDNAIQKGVIMKTMNISIRTGYFNFCRRNKTLNNPELLTF